MNYIALTLAFCILILLAPLPFNSAYRNFAFRGNGELRWNNLNVNGSVLLAIIAVLALTLVIVLRLTGLHPSPTPPLNSCIDGYGRSGRVFLVVGTSDGKTHADEFSSYPSAGDPVYSTDGTYEKGYAKWSCAAYQDAE